MLLICRSEIDRIPKKWLRSPVACPRVPRSGVEDFAVNTCAEINHSQATTFSSALLYLQQHQLTKVLVTSAGRSLCPGTIHEGQHPVVEVLARQFYRWWRHFRTDERDRINKR
jgi:hypothetical protein